MKFKVLLKIDKLDMKLEFSNICILYVLPDFSEKIYYND